VRLSFWLITITISGCHVTATHNFTNDDLAVFADDFDSHLAGDCACKSTSDSHESDNKRGSHIEEAVVPEMIDNGRAYVCCCLGGCLFVGLFFHVCKDNSTSYIVPWRHVCNHRQSTPFHHSVDRLINSQRHDVVLWICLVIAGHRASHKNGSQHRVAAPSLYGLTLQSYEGPSGEIMPAEHLHTLSLTRIGCAHAH
jgi:hypothetical protein